MGPPHDERVAVGSTATNVDWFRLGERAEPSPWSAWHRRGHLFQPAPSGREAFTRTGLFPLSNRSLAFGTDIEIYRAETGVRKAPIGAPRAVSNIEFVRSCCSIGTRMVLKPMADLQSTARRLHCAHR